MPDYRLENLSPRSFEQLVQSLALKVLGKKVTIFGDGPDGGREATFEVSYPDGPKPLDGEQRTLDGIGIVQAKFRQKPSTTPSDDVAWLEGRVNEEMSSYLSRESKKRPLSYLLATNISLSAVPQHGGVDRVHALMERYKARFGWKEFDIWDGNKIARYLDGDVDIRTTYSAWITSGDVLSAVLSDLGHSDCHEVMTAFMQKELLSAQYANLRQAGHEVEQRIPLSQVFVDLPVSHKQELKPFADDDVAAAGFLASMLVDGDLARSTDSEVDADIRRGRMVLLGGPGQGKTTLGQFACQLYRASLLRTSDVRMSAEVQGALDTLSGQVNPKTPQPRCRRYPIHIDIKRLADYLASDSSSSKSPPSLLKFIRDTISRRAGFSLKLSALRTWLTRYPWFVFLDGLDEVSAGASRGLVAQCLRDFAVDAAGFRDVFMLVTCRPQSYTHDFEERYYNHLWLAPLSDGNALEYGRLLTRSRHGSNEAEVHERTLETCVANPSTSRLMRSPLQVTIMTALVERLGPPPEQRWNLFSEYYRVIYDREMGRNTSWSRVLGEFRSDVDAIHRKVGFDLQRDSENAGSYEATISVSDFQDIVRARMSRQGHSGARLADLVEKLGEAVRDRLVFLAGLQEGRVGFEVRSLQEFMAADYLVDAPDADSDSHGTAVKENLRRVSSSAYWRNVLLFAIGRIYSRDQHFRDFVEAECQRMNEDSTLSVSLAGSRIALDVLEDGSARSQPNSVRALLRIALRLIRCADPTLIVRLGLLGSEVTESVLSEESMLRVRADCSVEAVNAWILAWIAASRRSEWAMSLLSPEKPRSRASGEALFIAARSANVLLPLRQLVNHHIYSVSFFQSLSLSETAKTELATTLTFRSAIAYQKDSADVKRSDQRWGNFRVPYPGEWNNAVSQIEFELRSIYLSEPWEVELPPLDRRADWHVDWRAAAANVEFARNPSTATLAEILENSGSYFINDKSRSILLCWPVEYCIGECRDVSELADIARAARDGALGDETDWKAAEQRWRRAELKKFDFEVDPKSDSLKGGRFGKQGFPMCAATALVTKPLKVARVRAWLGHLERATGRLAAQLSANVAFFLANLSGEANASNISTLYVSALDHNLAIDPEAAIVHILAANLNKNGALFCDRVGNAQFRRPFEVKNIEVNQLNQLRTSLIENYKKSPGLLGLLRLISYLPPSPPTAHRPPIDLAGETTALSRSDRCARLVLRFDHLQWYTDDVGAMAASAVECLDERPDLIRRVCSVLQLSGLTGEKQERLVAELFRLLPETWANHDMRLRLVETSDDLVRRRRLVWAAGGRDVD